PRLAGRQPPAGLARGRPDAALDLAAAASRRRRARDLRPAVRRHRLCAADAVRAGAGPGDRHVRDLHRLGDLGRQRPPRAGTPPSRQPWADPPPRAQAPRPPPPAAGSVARLVGAGMVSTRFSTPAPADPGMLDVVGFDTATPQLISDFARGAL